MGWEGLQAVYFRESPASEVSLPPVSQHVLVPIIRPPEKFDLRYEGVKAGHAASRGFDRGGASL